MPDKRFEYARCVPDSQSDAPLLAADLRGYARGGVSEQQVMTRFDTLLTFTSLPVTILMAALLLAHSVKAQSLDETADDLIHSDLPVFARGADNEWPQHFYDDDSFGCTSRVAFGSAR